MRVVANRTYTYVPVALDKWHPPVGVTRGVLKVGDTVRVVRMPGCPHPNTMGHAHIEMLDGTFAGLVMTASLMK